jgi:hypothetical protein
VGDQSLGEMPADAIAALDRPHPIGVPPPAEREHGSITVPVRAEPARG